MQQRQPPRIKVAMMCKIIAAIRIRNINPEPSVLHPCVYAQVYSADEAFVTGTFAGLIPVREVDGRIIGDGRRGGMTAALQQAYMLLMEREAAGGRGQEAAARQRESQDY